MASDVHAGKSAAPTATSAAAVHSIAQFQHAYEEEEKILGYECTCGYKTVTFLLECPRCRRKEIKQATFPTVGEVRSFSLQNFPSDEFINDAPYAYALITLSNGAVVTGWLPTIKSPQDLAIGDKVRWTKSYKVGMVFEKVKA